jgi:hypothetical protein
MTDPTTTTDATPAEQVEDLRYELDELTDRLRDLLDKATDDRERGRIERAHVFLDAAAWMLTPERRPECPECSTELECPVCGWPEGEADEADPS